jgi:hypothetical protein
VPEPQPDLPSAGRSVTLHLWNGQTGGTVKWWDLGAVGLDTGQGDLLVVQRHAVERWDPFVQQANG